MELDLERVEEVEVRLYGWSDGLEGEGVGHHHLLQVEVAGVGHRRRRRRRGSLEEVVANLDWPLRVPFSQRPS